MAFPGFIYETLGTALFVVVSSQAVAAASSVSIGALFFGLSWALCHVTFNDKTEAFFNPVFSIANYIYNDSRDIGSMFSTVLGQFLGAFVGVGCIGALGAESAATYESGLDLMQTLVVEAFVCALLAKMFLTSPDSSISREFWLTLVIMLMSLVAGHHAMNPARHAGIVWGSDNSVGGQDVMIILGGFVGAIAGGVCHAFHSGKE